MDPIVIVGGGIIGTGLAYRLREAPTDVTLVEKGGLGSGTTSASIAMFSWIQTDPDEFTHRLRERAWSEYRPLIEDGTIGFERIGALIAAETEGYLATLERAADRLDEYGLEIETRTAEELAEFNIDPEGLAGAIYVPDEGYLDPHEIIHHWVDEARDVGVTVETSVEVTDVHTDNEGVTGVETTAGDRSAGTVINAAGPWAPRINEMVDVSLPLRHTYGRILVLQRKEPFSLPFVTFESGDYFRQEGHNQAFAGRLEKTYDDATTVDPDAVHSIEESFRRDVARNTARFVPLLHDADVINEWVGLRTVTPDAKPIVGPTGVDGFLVACGMSGLGITLSPAISADLAEYAVTDESNETIRRLAAGRFG